MKFLIVLSILEYSLFIGLTTPLPQSNQLYNHQYNSAMNQTKGAYLNSNYSTGWNNQNRPGIAPIGENSWNNQYQQTTSSSNAYNAPLAGWNNQPTSAPSGVNNWYNQNPTTTLKPPPYNSLNQYNQSRPSSPVGWNNQPTRTPSGINTWNNQYPTTTLNPPPYNSLNQYNQSRPGSPVGWNNQVHQTTILPGGWNNQYRPTSASSGVNPWNNPSNKPYNPLDSTKPEIHSIGHNQFNVTVAAGGNPLKNQYQNYNNNQWNQTYDRNANSMNQQIGYNHNNQNSNTGGSNPWHNIYNN